MSITNDRYHILVVEDSFLAQKAAKMLLLNLGYQVIVVSTGQEALDAYQDCDGIFLDIGLPDISGLDVCQKFEHKRARHIYLSLH